MKRLLLITLAMLCASALVAQNRSGEPTVSGFYNRASYSLIMVNGDGQRSAIDEWWKKYQGDNKFDYNHIKSNRIDQKYSNNDEYSSSELRRNITSYLSEEKIGRQVVSHIFDRQPNGEMSDSTVRARGLYNASVGDMNSADAAAIGRAALEDNGYLLLDKCYLIFLEFYDHKREDGSQSAYARCVLYKLKLDHNILNEVIFGQAWVEPTDSEAVRKAKNEIFNSIEFEFECVGTLYSMGFASVRIKDNKNYMEDLYDELYEQALYNLSRRIEDFKVQAPVLSTKPVEARIGSKESISNGDRYDIYEFVKRNGEIEAKRRAIVRAADVGENRGDNAVTSTFVQVAGRGINEGYVLKQRNDMKMALTPYYRSGSMEGYGLQYEVLSSVETNGKMFSGNIFASSTTFDMVDLNAGGVNYLNQSPELFGDAVWKGISYGMTFNTSYHFARYFEIGYNITFAADFLSSSILDEEDEEIEEESFSGTVFAPGVGAQLRINLFYPLHITLSADYAHTLGAGTKIDDVESDRYQYNSINTALKSMGKNREGLGYTLGVTYRF